MFCYCCFMFILVFFWLSYRTSLPLPGLTSPFMAKYNQGPTGSFSGKIGPVVGSSWNGIPYMKSKPIRTAKATKGELANRAKFKIAQQWLTPLLDFVRVGWNG